jgi:hypothetical protein
MGTESIVMAFAAREICTRMVTPMPPRLYSISSRAAGVPSSHEIKSLSLRARKLRPNAQKYMASSKLVLPCAFAPHRIFTPGEKASPDTFKFLHFCAETAVHVIAAGAAAQLNI